MQIGKIWIGSWHHDLWTTSRKHLTGIRDGGRLGATLQVVGVTWGEGRRVLDWRGWWSCDGWLWTSKQGPLPCSTVTRLQRHSVWSRWRGGKAKPPPRMTNDTAKLKGKTVITHGVNLAVWQSYPSEVKPVTWITILHFNPFQLVKQGWTWEIWVCQDEWRQRRRSVSD